MLNCRFCKFSTAGKTAPGVKMKLESQKGAEDGCGGGAASRREVCGYGRNIFMGYLNRDNDTKVRSYRRRNVTHSTTGNRSPGPDPVMTPDTLDKFHFVSKLNICPPTIAIIYCRRHDIFAPALSIVSPVCGSCPPHRVHTPPHDTTRVMACCGPGLGPTLTGWSLTRANWFQNHGLMMGLVLRNPAVRLSDHHCLIIFQTFSSSSILVFDMIVNC